MPDRSTPRVRMVRTAPSEMHLDHHIVLLRLPLLSVPRTQRQRRHPQATGQLPRKGLH